VNEEPLSSLSNIELCYGGRVGYPIIFPPSPLLIPIFKDTDLFYCILLFPDICSCHNWNYCIEVLLDMLQLVKYNFTIHPLNIPNFFLELQHFLM